MPPSEPLDVRFWRKVDKGAGDDGCWLWTGAKDHWGYGKIRTGVGRQQKVVHRVAYELLVGAIPDGLQLDHLCRQTSCVNPAHLEPVTGKENSLRSESIPALNARKTTCSKGHPFNHESTYHWVDARGRSGRRCRICRRESQIRNGYTKGTP